MGKRGVRVAASANLSETAPTILQQLLHTIQNALRVHSVLAATLADRDETRKRPRRIRRA